MEIFYYTKTGHRFGLDNFRKAVAIIESIPEIDFTLLTSDYRIASASREFGIKKAIGIDVLRNIPNVAPHGSIMIYDSDEHNETQLLEMGTYFSKFIRLSENPNDEVQEREFLLSPFLANSERVLNGYPISSNFFQQSKKELENILFFGDDDYNKELLSYRDFSDFQLLLGFYFFFDYEKELSFKNYFENEEYEKIVKTSKNLITSSHHSALESLASGGSPIFIERYGRERGINRFLESFNIPILKNPNLDEVQKLLSEKRKFGKIENSSEKIRDWILNIVRE